MIRGWVACIGCFALGLLWFWLTGDPVLSSFTGGIGSGIWISEIIRNEPDWED